MLLPTLATLAGLVLLVWSADRFVEGAASAAHHFGMPPLVIGMVVVGFGTSAPEMVVSAISALQGAAGIALGNAYGSNIANISLILGLSALIAPIAFRSQVLVKELPMLVAVTGLSALLLWDGALSRGEAAVLLAVFAVLLGWTLLKGRQKQPDALGAQMEQDLDSRGMPLSRSLFWLAAGLCLLLISSRLLVWGAVSIATEFGVSDLVIGLTVVALGTSLPELASSLAAARRGEHDIALGNILGSNLFNTLGVVGLAGVIAPLQAPSEVLSRDMPVMGLLTLSLFVIGYGFRGPGRINRVEGAILFLCYLAYTGYLVAPLL